MDNWHSSNEKEISSLRETGSQFLAHFCQDILGEAVGAETGGKFFKQFCDGLKSRVVSDGDFLSTQDAWDD